MSTPSLRLRPVAPFYLIFTVLLLTVCAGTAHAQSFSTPTDYPLGDNPNSGIAADFNGDGKLDMAIGNVLHKNVGVLISMLPLYVSASSPTVLASIGFG